MWFKVTLIQMMMAAFGHEGHGLMQHATCRALAMPACWAAISLISASAAKHHMTMTYDPAHILRHPSLKHAYTDASDRGCLAMLVVHGQQCGIGD